MNRLILINKGDKTIKPINAKVKSILRFYSMYVIVHSPSVKPFLYSQLFSLVQIDRDNHSPSLQGIG